MGVTEIADAAQGLTRFLYDPNGNLEEVRDAKGQATEYTYDVMDRLATRCPVRVSGMRIQRRRDEFFNKDAESSVCMTRIGMIFESMQAPAMTSSSLRTGEMVTLNRVFHCNDQSLHGQRSSVSPAALPHTRWDREPGSLPVVLPSPQPRSTAGGVCEDIHPRPDFGGGAPVQMLMGTKMIVREASAAEDRVELISVLDRVRCEQTLHRPDEAFDPAVLSGTVGSGVLRTNA